MLAIMFDPLTEFWLASDAARLTALGAVCWTIAALAALMEWRRNRTRPVERLERVGWMPWTGLFLVTAWIGAGLLFMGVPALLGEI